MEFHVLVFRPGRMAGATDFPGLRSRRTPAEAGARDQLHLAVRLAVADLLLGTVPLPLFLDDPFVHFDFERQEHLRAALDRLAGSRQWVLLTHRADLATWGAPVEVVAVRSVR